MLLSKQILKYRKAAHLTQEQLAAELGVTPQAISNWERGGAPDISLLPGIANFFKITIDELMGNDVKSVIAEKNTFWTELRFVEGEERIIKIVAYCRKYPHDASAMEMLMLAISQLDPKTRVKYLSLMNETCEKILAECNDPDKRNHAVTRMCLHCPPDERENWLQLLPVRADLRKQNICSVLAINDKDWEKGAVQAELLALIQLEEHLNNRIPDQMGPERKRRQSQYFRGILEALSDEDGCVPDAWICQYAYETLVLSATLFALGKTEEAWKRFEQAIDAFRRWYVFEVDAILATGFERIYVLKTHYIAFYTDTNGEEKQDIIVYSTSMHADIKPQILLEYLTSPAWAWFDSVRADNRFISAVEWVESLNGKKGDKK